MIKLTLDMTLNEAFVNGNQEAMAEVLAGYGMHCLHCALAHGETIAQAAQAHGANPEELLSDLQNAANS